MAMAGRPLESNTRPRILSRSKYWAHRDKQFGYTSFLEREVPRLPNKLKFLYSERDIGDVPVAVEV